MSPLGAHRDVFGRTGYAQSMQLAAATLAQSDNTVTTSVTSYNRERFVVVSLIRKRSDIASSVAVAAIRDIRRHAFTENIGRYSRATYSCIRVAMVARNTRIKSLFAVAHTTIRFNFETRSKLAKAGEIGIVPAFCYDLDMRAIAMWPGCSHADGVSNPTRLQARGD
jgi:hypothetical protein